MFRHSILRSIHYTHTHIYITHVIKILFLLIFFLLYHFLFCVFRIVRTKFFCKKISPLPFFPNGNWKLFFFSSHTCLVHRIINNKTYIVYIPDTKSISKSAFFHFFFLRYYYLLLFIL